MITSLIDNESNGADKVVMTSGVVLADGAIVEQLAENRLLLRSQGEEQISSTVEYDGVRYAPVPLDGAYEQALHLPPQSADYASTGVLLQDIAAVIHHNTGLPTQSCLLVAGFVLATWVGDFLPGPLLLNLVGTSSSCATLRDVLYCLCRRPLTLAEPSLRQLCQVPPGVVTTIFLRHPSEVALRRLLDLSRQQPVLVGNQLLQISAAAMVVSTTHPLSLPAIRLILPPPASSQRLSKQRLQDLSDLQEQLLRYRLMSYERVSASVFDAAGLSPQTREIARSLGACAEGDASLQQLLLDALAEQDENAKSATAHSPEAVVLEALLVLIHESCPKAYVGEVTRIGNGILLARQDSRQLAKQEVGAMLREVFALSTRRDSKGVCVALDPSAAAKIHGEALPLGVLSLLQPRESCTFCCQLSRAASSSDGDDGSTSSTSCTSTSTPNVSENGGLQC